MVLSEETKVCKDCGSEKSVSEFYTTYGRYRYSRCKPCWNKSRKSYSRDYSKKWRQENKEKLKAKRKQYYEVNKEHIIKKADEWRKASNLNQQKATFSSSRATHGYNLTWNEYQELIAKQKGEYVLCSRRPKKLFVDHDHFTGKVRGLLCPRCNQCLAAVEDDKLLKRMLQYLKQVKEGN